MLRDFRKIVASSASEIILPEIFPWQRWLKVPKTSSKKVEPFRLAHYDTSKLKINLESAEIKEHKKFLDYSRVHNIENFSLASSAKNSRIFFGIAKAKIENIKIDFPVYSLSYIKNIDNFLFDSSVVEVYFSQYENIRDFSGETFEIGFIDNLPKVFEINFVEKLPDISNIDFISHIKEPTYVDFALDQSDTIEIGLTENYPEIVECTTEFTGAISNEIQFLMETPEDSIKTILPSNREAIETLTLSVDFKFRLPNISNVLSELIPKTFEISLLNHETFNLQNSSGVSVDYVTEFKNSTHIEEIEILKNKKSKTFFLKNITLSKHQLPSQIDVPEFKTECYSQPIDFIEEEQHCYFHLNESNTIEDLSDQDNNFNKLIEFLLLPDSSANSEVTTARELTEYQKDGIKFLSECNFGILADQLGMGKTIQSICAVKELLLNGRITSVLVICSNTEINNHTDDNKKSYLTGWLGQISAWVPQISAIEICGDQSQRQAKWRKKSIVTIASYDNFFKDIDNNLIEMNRLREFDLVIFDDADILLSNSYNIQKLLNTIKSKYSWLLSSFPLENIKAELYTLFANVIKSNNKIGSSLRRTREIIALGESNNSPKLSRQNIWLELDEHQLFEYEETLTKGINHLLDFIRTGNPYRTQANIFSLLHQLKHIVNKSKNFAASPKLEYLSYQLKTIAAENEQVVVFTQYEKLGIELIEQQMKKSNISYVKFAAGMSPEELKKSYSAFQQDKSITVFLHNIKSGKAKNQIPETQYIIHFDKWFNPAGVWELEDNIKNKSFQKKMIYSYLLKNSIDEKIEELLGKKGLKNKQLFQNFTQTNVNNCISENDWINLLINHAHEIGITIDQDLLLNFTELDIQKKVSHSAESTSSIGERTIALFDKLGYKALNYSNGTPESSEITGYTNLGKKFAAKSFYNISVDPDSISGFIETKFEEKDIEYMFLILPDTIGKDLFSLKSDQISVISKSSLLKYFDLFSI